MIDEHTLVIAISQSGETIDTLAAMKEARSRGAHVLAITNVMGSQMTRECDSVLYTRAGLEIGVAATKTFTAQVTLMYLLALKLGLIRAHDRPRPGRGAARRGALAARPGPGHDRPRRALLPVVERFGKTSSSSTWAATSACRSLWRVRSS